MNYPENAATVANNNDAPRTPPNSGTGRSQAFHAQCLAPPRDSNSDSQQEQQEVWNGGVSLFGGNGLPQSNTSPRRRLF